MQPNAKLFSHAALASALASALPSLGDDQRRGLGIHTLATIKREVPRPAR
jgi:hypothetical protein